MKYISMVIILLLIISIPSVYAHHKDDHEQGQGQNQGGGQSGNNPPDHANNDKDKSKDKNLGSGQGCSYITITNNSSEYARCKIIDTVSPRIIEIVTLEPVTCIKATDDVGISKVYGIYISGAIEFKHHSGSYDWYCTIVNEKVLYILAEDLAGNRGIRL